MKIHSYEKFWLAASMVIIVGFIVTITYGSIGLGIAMINDSEETIDAGEVTDHPEFGPAFSGDKAVHQVGENEYDVYVVALQFLYRPGEVVVPANSTVNFHLTSADVIHSFSVVGTNANTMIIPGEIATMTVEANNPGEYGIICSEYCGSGHHGMEGKLIVQPEDEFQLEDGQ
jgi:cytochrome c oxidase subunit 2